MIKVEIMQIKSSYQANQNQNYNQNYQQTNNQQQQQAYQNENLNNRATNANANFKGVEISNKQLDKIRINQCNSKCKIQIVEM